MQVKQGILETTAAIEKKCYLKIVSKYLLNYLTPRTCNSFKS